MSSWTANTATVQKPLTAEDAERAEFLRVNTPTGTPVHRPATNELGVLCGLRGEKLLDSECCHRPKPSNAENAVRTESAESADSQEGRCLQILQLYDRLTVGVSARYR